eukprot:jgi/Psemu1/22344/gm1.22344_g
MFEVLTKSSVEDGIAEPPKKDKAPLGDALLTATVTALTDHQLKLSEDIDRKRAEAVKRHTVTEVWGPLYTMRLLLLLCRKKDEDELPPIFLAWAKKGKQEKTHTIFQSQVASKFLNPTI